VAVRGKGIGAGPFLSAGGFSYGRTDNYNNSLLYYGLYLKQRWRIRGYGFWNQE
ncbi:hypothetical protein A2U01_0009597, partial [Trifolium medium]|nr:hypothetical protein [Trifolium medium]